LLAFISKKNNFATENFITSLLQADYWVGRFTFQRHCGTICLTVRFCALKYGYSKILDN
jgi:hypothetical protein